MTADEMSGQSTDGRTIVRRLVIGLSLSTCAGVLLIASGWWWLRSQAQECVAEALAEPVVYEGVSVLESGSLALEYRLEEALFANLIHYYYVFPDGHLMRSFGDGQVLLRWDPDASADEADEAAKEP